MTQQYRPLFKLDSGGMAEVYVAESESLAGFKKRVAIKRILPSLLKNEKFVRMFLDEARLSLNLNHANTVSVFDIGKSDNAYFIVMEYVEGTTLRALLEYFAKKGATIPVPLTLWILNEVLKGLNYAHNLRDERTQRPLGIVHRDMSPPNILISWNGEVKITDFGLAKATTQVETTDPGVVKGKFAYLSPEAAHGRELDHRADVFAVGILAWEMLTGRRLFLGDTDYETVQNVRRTEAAPVHPFNPDIPSELDPIIARALAADPADRYPNCNDFADDLLAVLFRHSMRVSSRDLTELLRDVRTQQADEKPAAGEARDMASRGTNLIMDMLSDELVKFRSLEESEDKSITHTGAMPLDSLGIDDGPVFETQSAANTPPPFAAELSPPPGAAASHAAGPPMPTSRLPSPTPKRAPGGLVGWLLGGLVAAALAASAYFYFVSA